MMPYQFHQLYEAERTKNPAEVRRADEQLGRMAEGMSRLWRRATRPTATMRVTLHGRRGLLLSPAHLPHPGRLQPQSVTLPGLIVAVEADERGRPALLSSSAPRPPGGAG